MVSGAGVKWKIERRSDNDLDDGDLDLIDPYTVTQALWGMDSRALKSCGGEQIREH